MDPSQNIIDTVNIYDAEGEWLDEEDDDDMDFEPTTDDSEDAEFFDPSEDPEAEFQGIMPAAIILQLYTYSSPVLANVQSSDQTLRTD